MFERTANARIILEEEFKRQTRRIGWRVFTVGVPLVMIIVAFLVPLVIDALSDDDDEIGSGLKIGYIDNSGVTDSLEALFVIPADYISTGNVDWYHKD
jgi:hypothetical protein